MVISTAIKNKKGMSCSQGINLPEDKDSLWASMVVYLFTIAALYLFTGGFASYIT